MKVTQISIGRFHHFHLARQLEKYNLLDCIWTGYPQFKLADEEGIPVEKIKSFPWVQAPFMFRGKLGLGNWHWLNQEWAWLAQETLDHTVSKNINHPSIVIALSANGLQSGTKAQKNGGYYICDRGSSHIQFQNGILKEEYSRWGLKYKDIDARIIAKEEAEYAQANLITVPSEFVKQSFIKKGIPENKIAKVTYGARLNRFSKVAEPDEQTFSILWVGSVSIRKGFLDLLQAFTLLKHPKKELVVVGAISAEIKELLAKQNLNGVIFKGNVPNDQLPYLYSAAHVFVLPSMEEGLAMVQGEALACGCPVIATYNAGASDLFDDNKEGFIVPIRSPGVIAERLQQLADDKDLRIQMSLSAIQKMKGLGGWDSYGLAFKNVLEKLSSK
ncbi:glycosyltransferase [Mucilaginibacter sp. X4EP1]|uniref:glycosyltransferase family 4 protein n=1 Tax=Mucilaginibacter sp. X4EP1 TaxID=2723092 RepID=UPI0021682C57|nr:glycosyltransferase family 4 protein [Mucilaginibacter sp. X4EP1]MCS3815436.1 glycosyltransferase involved in cell wall biosynthesis [Mucilaginibacter sp. X4EP1]